MNVAHNVNIVYDVAVASSRRQKRRQATIAEIKEAALDRVASGGWANLTVRGLASDLAMSPAALYRYFDSLDDLIAQLRRDAYDGLADHVKDVMSMTQGSASDKLVAGILGYRGWAVSHRHQFLMVFGTPIGDQIAQGGEVHAANARIGEVFFEVAAHGVASGELSAPDIHRGLTDLEKEFAAAWDGTATPFPVEMVPILLGIWGHFHGLIHLELVNQLLWIYPDPAAFFEEEARRMIAPLAVVT